MAEVPARRGQRVRDQADYHAAGLALVPDEHAGVSDGDVLLRQRAGSGQRRGDEARDGGQHDIRADDAHHRDAGSECSVRPLPEQAEADNHDAGFQGGLRFRHPVVRNHALRFGGGDSDSGGAGGGRGIPLHLGGAAYNRNGAAHDVGPDPVRGELRPKPGGGRNHVQPAGDTDGAHQPGLFPDGTGAGRDEGVWVGFASALRRGRDDEVTFGPNRRSHRDRGSGRVRVGVHGCRVVEAEMA